MYLSSPSPTEAADCRHQREVDPEETHGGRVKGGGMGSLISLKRQSQSGLASVRFPLVGVLSFGHVYTCQCKTELLQG